ncbi:S26 family signal peptidase [Streptomyces sp. NPDC000070]|uniref:S26 family signal peptidase n=1 Tax=Streptomyces sp. NPDC000070 TaxID=3154240 RepID=UPI00332273F7
MPGHPGRVPPGRIVVLGDNAAVSTDSPTVGLVPLAEVVAVAFGNGAGLAARRGGGVGARWSLPSRVSNSRSRASTQCSSSPVTGKCGASSPSCRDSWDRNSCRGGTSTRCAGLRLGAGHHTAEK